MNVNIEAALYTFNSPITFSHAHIHTNRPPLETKIASSRYKINYDINMRYSIVCCAHFTQNTHEKLYND